MATEDPLTVATPGICASCGTQLAPNLLSCPSCHALVHSARLKELAAQAEAAQRGADLPSALARWRDVLELLPEGTRQHTVVTERINALGRDVDRLPRSQSAPGEARPWLKTGWAAIAAAAIFVLTKGKLLLVGLTKTSTLFSMLLFMAVYWQVWGWKFAVGVVIGIYIHEMGHVAALARYGIKASAPMFIPGLGAVVRLKQVLTDVRQDARVGLAGPIWGLGAGLAAYALGRYTGSQSWFAIAQTTGFINLFNMIPFWQLDGGRAFHALNRAQRLTVAIAIGLAWYQSEQGLLILLLALAVIQTFSKSAPEAPDHGTLVTFILLIAALTWLSGITVITG